MLPKKTKFFGVHCLREELVSLCQCSLKVMTYRQQIRESKIMLSVVGHLCKVKTVRALKLIPLGHQC